MNEHVKCCPFCSSTAIEVCKTGPVWVECVKCGARADSRKTRRGAIAAWNRRDHTEAAATIMFDMMKG